MPDRQAGLAYRSAEGVTARIDGLTALTAAAVASEGSAHFGDSECFFTVQAGDFDIADLQIVQ